MIKKAGVLFFTFFIMISMISCGSASSESSVSGNSAASGNAGESIAPGREAVLEAQEEKTQIIFDETQTSMLKPIDAVLLTQYLTRRTYDPSDPVTYWTTMYYYLSVYGPLISGTSYTDLEDGQYMILGVDPVRESGRTIFGETAAMPEIPESIHRISLHEDGYYYVKMDPRPQSVPELVSGIVNADGTCEIVARLCDTNGRALCVESFHLVRKTAVNSLLGVEYYYTISSVGLG